MSVAPPSLAPTVSYDLADNSATDMLPPGGADGNDDDGAAEGARQHRRGTTTYVSDSLCWLART